MGRQMLNYVSPSVTEKCGGIFGSPAKSTVEKPGTSALLLALNQLKRAIAAKTSPESITGASTSATSARELVRALLEHEFFDVNNSLLVPEVLGSRGILTDLMRRDGDTI